MTNANNSDQLHRFIFDDADIRGEIISLESSYQEAYAHQNLPATARALLGQFLAAAGLLSEALKFEGSITIQARGDGLVPLIMAEASSTRTLRGIVKISPNTLEEQLKGCTLAQLIGDGILTLTMDPKQGHRYQGIVEMTGSSLAESLTAYFTQSEQLPTRFWLFANQQKAGGILLQALPRQNSNESTDDEHWNTAVQLAKTVTADEIFQLAHDSLLGRLFGDEFTVRLFEPHSIQFACQCSGERCANTLAALGKEDAHALCAEQGTIDINCEFCGNHYSFTDTEVSAIFTVAEEKKLEQIKKLH